MSHRKLLVDNVTCSRRFHISYDDKAKAVGKTQVICTYCNVVVFTAEDHPPVRLSREENLVQTAELCDNIVRECKFHDAFTERTVPGAKHEPIYKTK